MLSSTWTATGRVDTVTTPAAGSTDASYVYDPEGNTLIQRNPVTGTTTLYFPDQEITLTTSTGPSRAYYDRQRAMGRTHTQALLRLARQRINVIYAMLRDGTSYQPHHTRPGLQSA